MAEPAQVLVEQAMREKYGEPSCGICENKANCLIAFMGPAVKIKASYVAAPGCGRCDPREHGSEEQK